MVMDAVTKGKRPARPSDNISGKRGLDDGIWQLIVRCWGMIPTGRPSASHVVRQLHSMSKGVSAQRPNSDWDESFTSRLRSRMQYPFSLDV
jgi:hypothetical protein